MKIVDANLLIYAANLDSPLHSKAKRWLERALDGEDPVAFPWMALLAFLRVTTRAGLLQKPLSIEAGFDFVSSILDSPAGLIIHPGPRHSQILRELLEPLGTGGNLTTDAHLAALAIEHRATLCSCDSDFARFPGVKWMNPLA